MLIPFFTFVLFLIIVTILGAVDTDSAQNTKNNNGIVTTPRIDKILKTELDKRDKAEIIKEEIKNTPTELKPKPLEKLDINKTPLEQTIILQSGVIK